ncbi:Uncharacterised protein [Bordetella pertussis]|nr:Uncharacterised protein [Bordetella pertussis]CFP59903.1 Uncharacterised protein [Bordetella pertussis]
MRRRARLITMPSGYWCDGVTKMKRGGSCNCCALGAMPSSSTATATGVMPQAISVERAPQ